MPTAGFKQGEIHIYLEPIGGLGHQAHLSFIRLGSTSLTQIKQA